MFEGAGNILKTNDFILVPLAELGDWVGGGTPSKSNPSYWENGTIPWVSPKDMKMAHIRAAEDNITEQAAKESATNLVPAGSILVVTRSGILRHTFPVAVADVPVTINQDLKALALKPEIDPKYVAFALRAFSRDILNQCSKQGTTVNSIETQKLLRFQIPLTSYPQQTRIIAEIEKQFSRLDEAVANLKRVKANLKRYKAAVLKAAVEGKLTEEWRRGTACRAHDVPRDADQGTARRAPTETGSELLQRILAERRKGAGKGKYKEPAAPDTANLPELPVGWVWSAFGQAFEVCVGATPSRAKAEYWNGTIPWVSSGEVAFCRIKTTRETITELGLKNTSTKVHPVGTILLGMIGEGKTRGQVAILDIEASNNQNSAAIRVSDTDIVPEYIYLFLEQEYENTRKRGSGGNQLALNKSRVEQIQFPLAPLAEQHQIVAEVERRLSIVAEAEAQVDANLRRADRLRQSILKQAFSGRLVPQDPNDEPASVLLERIRANAHVGAQHAAPRTRTECPKRAQQAAPLRKPRRQPEPEPTPAATYDFASLDSVLTAILNLMQPGHEYSRAEIADGLGLTTGRWNAAIQELKRRRQVRQVGERRGVKYLLY